MAILNDTLVRGALRVIADANIGGNVQAATFNGLPLSGSVGANTIPIRDSSGYVYFNYINTNIGADNGANSSSYFLYMNSNDGFIRKANAATIKTALSIPTAYLASASVSGNTLTINPNSGNAITFTPSFTDNNQTVKGNGTAFGANDAVNILGTSPISVTANATNKTITIAVADASTSAKGVVKIGTTASDAAAGNHTHSITLASDSGTSSISLAHGGKYKLTAGGNSVIFTMPGIPDYLAAVASVGGNNTSTYSYHRIMRLNASHGYADTEGTFYLTGNYINGPYYIFRVEQRANADNAAPSDTVIKVLMTNSDPANLKLGQYNYTSNGVNYVQTDIFVKVGTWPRMTLYKLGQNTAGSFTFFNSSEGSDASSHTEAYKDINGSNAEYASYACIGASSYTRTANGAVAVSTGYAASSHSHTITANATDGIWDITGTNGTNAVTYAVDAYSAKGTSARFYTAATNPTLTTRLNYDGYFYATKLYSGGNEVLTGHQSIKALDTTATTAQSTNNNEAIAGSGKITLHKVSKTGSYNDLNDKPTIPATNVIPGTATANKILLSTNAAGTAAWSAWSTAGFLETDSSGVVSVSSNIKKGTTSTDTNIYISGLVLGSPSDIGKSYIHNELPSGQLPKNQTYYLPFMASGDGGVLATQYWVGQQGYTTNQGTVIGSGLTANYFVVGNGTVNVKISSMKPGTSTLIWDTTSDVYIPTMKAISSYVTGLGYTTDSVSGANDGTNWTSITINGVTKNIPSGGSGGGITEISTQYIRIWDLNPGIYLLTYNGTKYIYYSGASGTATHTVKGGAGQVVLTVETYSTTTKTWYYDSINTSVGLASYTRFYGRTSSSSGSTSSTLLAPKYKHTILFTVNGYGSCKYDFINNSSSDISVLELINELIGKALGDMSETSGDAYFVFGNQNGDRLNPTINCTRYSVYNGTTINYVVSGAGLTINSQAATQI